MTAVPLAAMAHGKHHSIVVCLRTSLTISRYATGALLANSSAAKTVIIKTAADIDSHTPSIRTMLLTFWMQVFRTELWFYAKIS